MGKATFIKALKSFDAGPDIDLTPRSFAVKLRDFSTSSCRLKYSIWQVANKLCRVGEWFTSGGTYYNAAANVRSVDGRIVNGRSPSSRRHMKGLTNSKTMAVFTNEEKEVIGRIQPHNLLHNSAARREVIGSLSLPASRATVAEWRLEELKAMIITRRGGMTARDGTAHNKEGLQRIVRAYLSMEKETTGSTVYFNHARGGNGIFANIDTSERKFASGDCESARSLQRV